MIASKAYPEADGHNNEIIVSFFPARNMAFNKISLKERAALGLHIEDTKRAIIH